MTRTIDYLAFTLACAAIAYALSSSIAAQLTPILAHVSAIVGQ
jgi:hypothetical protein